MNTGITNTRARADTEYSQQRRSILFLLTVNRSTSWSKQGKSAVYFLFSGEIDKVGSENIFQNFSSVQDIR